MKLPLRPPSGMIRLSGSVKLRCAAGSGRACSGSGTLGRAARPTSCRDPCSFLSRSLQFRFGGFRCGPRTLPRFLLQRRFGFTVDLLPADLLFAPAFAGQIVATVAFAVQGVFGGVGFFRQRQQPVYFGSQLFLFLLHAVS